MFKVVAVLECPNRFETVAMSTSSAIINVALLCRRECNVTIGNPLILMNRLNQQDMLSGLNGSPFFVVNSLSV